MKRIFFEKALPDKIFESFKNSMEIWKNSGQKELWGSSVLSPCQKQTQPELHQALILYLISKFFSANLMKNFIFKISVKTVQLKLLLKVAEKVGMERNISK